MADMEGASSCLFLITLVHGSFANNSHDNIPCLLFIGWLVNLHVPFVCGLAAVVTWGELIGEQIVFQDW